MNNELFASELIKQFSGIWPSMRSTMRPDDIQSYQVQMVKALTENGLNTPEAIQHGFKKARSEGGQFPPSVPEFVRWCRNEKAEKKDYYIAPSRCLPSPEALENFSAMSKNLLEQINNAK